MKAKLDYLENKLQVTKSKSLHSSVQIHYKGIKNGNYKENWYLTYSWLFGQLLTFGQTVDHSHTSTLYLFPSSSKYLQALCHGWFFMFFKYVNFFKSMPWPSFIPPSFHFAMPWLRSSKHPSSIHQALSYQANNKPATRDQKQRCITKLN